MILNKLTKNVTLSQEFKLKRKYNHEYHLNFIQQFENIEIEYMLEQMALFKTFTLIANPDKKINGKKKRLADQLIIKTNRNGKKKLMYAIEYKTPHKLGLVYILTGFQDKIQLAEDVIDKNNKDSTYYIKRVVTIVITQLFLYIVYIYVRYGYINIGKFVIFLHILNDPAIVKYFIIIL